MSTLVGSGDWNDDTRWDSTFYPDNGNGGLTYDAVVDGLTVTIPALIDVEIESLSFTSGVIAGEGSLTLSGASSWDGGRLIGTGAGLALDGSGVLTLGTATGKVFGGQIFNAGTMVWTEGQIVSITSGPSGTAFRNTGTINLQGDGTSFNSAGAASVVNEAGGILSRTVGTGTATINLPLVNQGTVNVRTGTLRLTSGGGSSSGAFDIAAGAVLEITSDFTFESGASSSGDGNLHISDGTSVVAGDIALSNLQLTDGQIVGEGTISLSGASSWDGGRLIGTGAGLALDGSGVLTLGTATGKVFGGQISNAGTIVWTEGQIVSISSGPNGTAFRNTGTIDLQGDGISFNSAGAASVVNEPGGTLLRTVGTGTATINLPLVNQGTVDVRTGTLQVIHAGLTEGTWIIHNGSTLAFSGSPSLSNNAATLIVDGGGTIAGMQLESNSGRIEIRGDGAFQAPGKSGIFTNTGLLYVEQGSTFSAPETRVAGGSVEGSGTVSGTVRLMDGVIRSQSVLAIPSLAVGEVVVGGPLPGDVVEFPGVGTIETGSVLGDAVLYGNSLLTIPSVARLDGSVAVRGGQLDLAGSATSVVDVSGSASIMGTVEDILQLAGGTVSGVGSIGRVTSLGGSISSTDTLTIGGTFGVLSGQTTLAAGTLQVDGETTIESGGELIVAEGAALTGSGKISVVGGLSRPAPWISRTQRTDSPATPTCLRLWCFREIQSLLDR